MFTTNCSGLLLKSPDSGATYEESGTRLVRYYVVASTIKLAWNQPTFFHILKSASVDDRTEVLYRHG